MSTPQTRTGWARARQLWTLWRNEVEDPDPFYELMAGELASRLEADFGPLEGMDVLDLGCGPGYYTRALRQAGARVTPVDNSEESLSLRGAPVDGALLGDATSLDFPDGSFDGIVCSNLLEHTPDASSVVSEMSRVCSSGGWIYLSWTNWYSPWGGHDIAPWHYLGENLGPRTYERLHGRPERNVVGETLWPTHIASVLRDVESDPTLRILEVEPRYWPRLRFIMKVPGVREVLAWNCVITMAKS